MPHVQILFDFLILTFSKILKYDNITATPRIEFP